MTINLFTILRVTERHLEQNLPKVEIKFKAETKNKLRAVVDIEGMKEELKQLEDPPSTAWEKKITENRLPYSFFDASCEALAKNLLGTSILANDTKYTSRYFIIDILEGTR